MFSFVPYLWFRSLIHRVISFVVITTPHVPPTRIILAPLAATSRYYGVWSLISFHWKHVALAKLCAQNAILSSQLWKCCRKTHIGRPPCGYLLYLLLHSVVLVYVILSFRMYVKFKQLWFTVILKLFKFYFSLFFCVQLIICYILNRKARIYFFSLMKHFLVRFCDGSMLRRFVRSSFVPFLGSAARPLNLWNLWNLHRSIVSLTAFAYWGRKQSERIRHNFRVRESFGLGFRWCSKWWENIGFKC